LLYTGFPVYNIRVHIETMGKPPGCKLIRLSADIENGLIVSISRRGDFFASPEAGFDRAEARLKGIHAAGLGPAFDIFLKEENVEAAGINGAALGELLMAAVEQKTAAETSPGGAHG
jgi:hypothetical protein